MAQDVILLAQTEVAEVRESADAARGGSSTMPQKSNPIISEGIVAAARTNASLLAVIHQAAVHEHERATHGWQLDWLNLPQMFVLTAVSLRKALFLSQTLVVNVAQMHKNVSNSQGLMLAEVLNFALAAHMDRAEAKKLVGEACQIALAENKHLLDVVQGLTDLPLDWKTLRDEANYLGATAVFIDQVIQAAVDLKNS
jgi:3-carboxy-cis,cis-muconate cycloisomerase